jgi:nitrite reductase/ring-hydroxylating ferredoxin subunit
MSESVYICRLDELDDPASFGFSVQVGSATMEGFVVKKDGEVFAYRNQCPHTGAPLDWVEHQFLDLDGALIQCAVHDARFLIDSGECIAGPCSGDTLTPLQIAVSDGEIYLANS